MAIDFKTLMDQAREAAAKREADPEWQEAVRQQEARRARENAEWPLRASGIIKVLKPADTRAVLADELDETPAMRMVDAWVAQALEPSTRSPRWRNWLWVSGAPGGGKTMAAAKATRRLCPWEADTEKRQRQPRYVLFRDLMDAERKLRGFDRRDREEGRDVIEGAVQGYFVVLDEVGQELEADANLARLALHNFVDQRQASQGLTLVLSNKSAVDIDGRFRSEWYDQRTESRLKALLSRGPNGEALRDVKGRDLRGEPLLPVQRRGLT
jgi:DNA replication protein DnaC